MNPLLNIAIYQLIWFVAVLGGESLVWVAMVLILLHFGLTPTPKTDLVLVVLVLFIGVLIDGTLRLSGFFIFAEDRFPIPLWLGCLWMGLATVFNHSLGWLKNRLWLAALLGAIGGPAAYIAGGRLGAAEFSVSLPWSIAVLAIIWGLLVPGLVWLSSKIVIAGDRPLKVVKTRAT
ncbi:DUF2878 domain-containing protein [Pelovirga terrestris]|uniref:DUF2878 domain-containing protein n=1 Tax=Pelovirga terrestris TaxID=2771352 RepID=A0A8J6ULU4_9BACT|nr:DUF2878 domain-containing protein [Pelovirga terrestris]MBD1401822.1 DUF2878 domain-containing protein [Pelovirga terrestris]